MNLSCPVCAGSLSPDGHVFGAYPLFRCRECTLRCAPDAFDTAVDYEAIYQSSEYVATQVAAVQTLDAASFVHHPTYKAFFDRLRPSPGLTLLDLGCGAGRFCLAAHRLGWRVTGADVSAKALEIARQCMPFPLVHARADDLLRAPERYDVVTAFEVLEHLSQPLELLSQMRELAAPSGRVFCTVPNWDCEPVQTATRPDWLPPVHVCFFTQKALAALGARARFSKLKVGAIRTDPFPSHPKRMLGWLRRRAQGVKREALGLWLLGEK